jgi:hypothetical protein
VRRASCEISIRCGVQVPCTLRTSPLTMRRTRVVPWKFSSCAMT